jgi:hypothetical protein
VRRNLGSIKQCVTHESTKVLSVRKSVANTGTQKIYLVTENTKVSISLKLSVETVVTELNALNGESTKNAMVCGEDLQPISVN